MPAPALSMLDPQIAARLKRDHAGLVAAVIQQHDTGEVLMVGWMDDHALHRTLSTGLATYWSRSRQRYWVKGESSGNVQRVKSVALDCDGDALLVRVDQVGVACHTGERTCFRAGSLPVTGSPAVEGTVPPAAESTVPPVAESTVPPAAESTVPPVAEQAPAP